ncbi:hypothetical protein [Nonomuraea maritima]|uniref:hypothetical protein n=1 Tax=Nonomuraea maritima TaxID=683260 RepID=UPI00371E3753
MVKAFARIAAVLVGCGMAFAVQAGASADTPRETPSAFGQLLGRMLDDRVIAYNSPSHDSPTTISGSLDSGRSTGSNQYYSVGNVINSGDFSNGNGVLSPRS